MLHSFDGRASAPYNASYDRWLRLHVTGWDSLSMLQDCYAFYNFWYSDRNDWPIEAEDLCQGFCYLNRHNLQGRGLPLVSGELGDFSYTDNWPLSWNNECSNFKLRKF